MSDATLCPKNVLSLSIVYDSIIRGVTVVVQVGHLLGHLSVDHLLRVAFSAHCARVGGTGGSSSSSTRLGSGCGSLLVGMRRPRNAMGVAKQPSGVQLGGQFSNASVDHLLCVAFSAHRARFVVGTTGSSSSGRLGIIVKPGGVQLGGQLSNASVDHLLRVAFSAHCAGLGGVTPRGATSLRGSATAAHARVILALSCLVNCRLLVGVPLVVLSVALDRAGTALAGLKRGSGSKSGEDGQRSHGHVDELHDVVQRRR